MNKEKMSIKWKLIGYMMTFVAAILGLLWLFQVVFLDVFYQGIKERELRETANVISANLSADNFYASLEDYSFSRGISVEIVDTSGRVLYEKGSIPSSLLSRLQNEEKEALYNAALQNGGAYMFLSENTQNIQHNNYFEKKDPPKEAGKEGDKNPERALFEEEPKGSKNLLYAGIIDSGGNQCLLLLETYITPMGATSDILTVQLSFISIILVLLSLLLSMVLYGKISKPMIKTTGKARELGRADYDVEFNGGGYREIEQLNATLNYTAQELKKTETLQRELLANISHDLRTPLTLIGGYAEVIRDIPGENTPENLQVIIDETKRLSNLVTDILDVSKIQAGVSQTEQKKISLTGLINGLLARYAKLMEKEGYDIRFNYDEEIFVMGDETKLYQAIYNLVNNAVNYAGKDKIVIIEQIRKENRVRINVRDNGEGIEEQDLPYVWERYYKVDKSHKRQIVGTGLGLSIVKGILEQHGAPYGVESTVNQGSNFYFELKIMD